MKKKMNAFTLIELLAVIVILAVIALIATPIILGIVEDAKKDAFLRSVELVISTTDIDIANKTFEEEYTYTITDGNISNMEVSVKNTDGMNGNITYDVNGKEMYAIHNGVYCVKKTEEMSKAEISDYEGYCGFDTSPKCFAFSNGSITDYYDNEENDSSKKECPRDVVIPEAINGVTVTNIGYQAFYKKNIISVKLPNSVTKISQRAFAENKITSINFPNILESIGIEVFAYNKLSGELDLSYLINLTSIGQRAFEGSMDGSTNQITNVKFPSDLTTLDGAAFRNNAISGELDLSNTKITSIGNSAFAGQSNGSTNQITSVKFPDTLKTIETSAFAHNKLSGKLDLSYLTSLISIGESAFEGISDGSTNQITGIKLPNSITSIGTYAFINNAISGELDLSNTKITSIGNSAFAGSYVRNTNQITSIKLPSTIESIGSTVFQYNALTSVTFYGRSDLTGVTVVSNTWGWASGYNADNNIYFVNE